MKRACIIGGLVVALLVLWRFGPFRGDTRPNSGPDARPVTPSASPAPAAVEPRRGPPPERSTLADALNTPAQDIRTDLRLVIDLLDTFRTNFPQGGNPVGSNAEITSTLAGQNKLRLALIPLDHPAINRQGELCDRWGTPFFFHAESATKMEIRSAGPDRKLWTDDDVALHP